MTPLEIKLSQAINDEIVRQMESAAEMPDYSEPVINCDQLAQVCTRTIKTEMAAALRASAEKRANEAAAVNAAIDEVTK